MRTLVLVAALVGLSMLGGKCKGPKKPMEYAEVAVEDAWWAVDVEGELDGRSTVTVQVALEADLHESASRHDLTEVHFTRAGDETRATVVVDGEAFVFVVSPDGSLVTADED